VGRVAKEVASVSRGKWRRKGDWAASRASAMPDLVCERLTGLLTASMCSASGRDERRIAKLEALVTEFLVEVDATNCSVRVTIRRC
jgi:hypothetical protein